MQRSEEFARMTISSLLAAHPQIGEILARHNIDCVRCGSTSCLAKNVIATHTYSPVQRREIEAEIDAYLAGLGGGEAAWRAIRARVTFW